jgi:2'-5' RNA ligase
MMMMRMLYVLSYPVLTKADDERIETYRRIYEPERARFVHAHVTLVFGVRLIETKDLASQVAALTMQRSAFEVTFDRTEQAESPGGVHNVFLLVGEGALALESMHQGLYTGSLSYELLPGMPFRAHMTVATAASRDLLQPAIRDIPKLGLPIRGLIHALNIVSLENGTLTDVGRFQLKHGLGA